MLVFLRDETPPNPLHGGWMAWFNDNSLPIPGDEIDLNSKDDESHPLDGLWVVTRRRFRNVGEDRQHITLFIRRVEEDQ